MSFSFDNDKATDILLFTVHSLGGSVALQRLYMVLYQADLRYLALHGSLITGDTYQAMKYGPAPYQLQHMIKQKLVAASRRKEKLTVTDNNGVPELKAIGRTDSTLLAAAEVSCIFNTLTAIKKKTNEELSHMCKDYAWSRAVNGEIQLADMIVASGADEDMRMYILASYDIEQKYF